MTDILTRKDAGRPLTHAELDQNFLNLNSGKAESATLETALQSLPTDLSFSDADLTGQNSDDDVPRLFSSNNNIIGVLNGQAQALLNKLTASAARLASNAGAGLVGFIQLGTGAVLMTISMVMRERVSVTQFGADPTGASDSTVAFQRAMAFVALFGGGRIRMPNGSYILRNFAVNKARVIFEGETGGYTYERIEDPTKVGVRLIPAADATWVFRLKGTSTGAAAQGSGLRNAVVIDTSRGAHEYGLIVDSAATIVEDVTIQDFQYNWVKPAAANMNIYRRVATLGATKMGFLVSEITAKSYMHPNVPDIPDIPSTVYHLGGCVGRQNEWGAMIRDGIGACIGDITVFESNRQAGLYWYRTDNSTVRDFSMRDLYLENNYDGIGTDVSGYSITGNRAFLIGGASTYIAWAPETHARYQMVIDSQTHGGTGGVDTLSFHGGSINCDNPYQRCILGLSGVKSRFDRLIIGGAGDTDNLIKFTDDAQATEFIDPINGNDPVAEVPCLIANFGANLGSRGVYRKMGTSLGDNEMGGSYTRIGVNGGPLHIPSIPANDPRRSNPQCFDEYREINSFDIPWRVTSDLPFAVSNPDNRCEKLGRATIVRGMCTLTVTKATSMADKLFCDAFLPIQSEKPGWLGGTVLIEPVSGGATVVNNGYSPLRISAIASMTSVFNVLPPLTVGMVFTCEFEVLYPSVT